MSAKRKKGKAKRRGYSKKKRSGHKKDKRIPVGTTVGAAMTILALNAPNAQYSGQTPTQNFKTMNTASYTRGAKIAVSNAQRFATWAPLGAGILVTAVGSKVGVNKFVRKIPLLGKYLKA